MHFQVASSAGKPELIPSFVDLADLVIVHTRPVVLSVVSVMMLCGSGKMTLYVSHALYVLRDCMK